MTSQRRSEMVSLDLWVPLSGPVSFVLLHFCLCTQQEGTPIVILRIVGVVDGSVYVGNSLSAFR